MRLDAFFQQHDGALSAGEQPFFGVAHQAIFS